MVTCQPQFQTAFSACQSHRTKPAGCLSPASNTNLLGACVPQGLQQQLQSDTQRLQGLLDSQFGRAAEQEAAHQAAEQRVLEQARQLLQLQQAAEAKAQQLKQQALSHTEELQVCVLGQQPLVHAP